MANKALIVGISNYGAVQALESPDREIQEWRNLLMETYGFAAENIRLLANDRARKEEIMVRLQWLVDAASPGDKLVFVYCGHGVRLPERNAESGELLDHLDEALLSYPRPGEDLAQVALYDNDLFRIFADALLPNTTLVTFIFDCCFAGGLNFRDFPRSPRAMSVPLPVDLEHRCEHRVKTKTRLWRTRETMPVFVSAAGELDPSVELELDGVRRSLFSYHAIKALRANPQITYNELLEAIREPMNALFPQYPNVRGDKMRRNNSFLN